MTQHSIHTHSGPLFFLALAILDNILRGAPIVHQIFAETSLGGDRIGQLGIEDAK